MKQIITLANAAAVKVIQLPLQRSAYRLLSLSAVIHALAQPWQPRVVCGVLANTLVVLWATITAPRPAIVIVQNANLVLTQDPVTGNGTIIGPITGDIPDIGVPAAQDIRFTAALGLQPVIGLTSCCAPLPDFIVEPSMRVQLDSGYGPGGNDMNVTELTFVIDLLDNTAYDRGA